MVIYIWNTVQEVVKFEIIPDDPRSYDLSKAKEISQQIQSLPEGEYTLEIHAWLDCDAESFRNMFGQKFDIT